MCLFTLPDIQFYHYLTASTTYSHKLLDIPNCFNSCNLRNTSEGLPCAPVVKNPPSSAGDARFLDPQKLRSHMLQGTKPSHSNS